MGEDGAYPEEAPAHNVKVCGFWIDEYAVTNADFAAFVKATGYRIVADRPPDPAAFPGADPSLLTPGSSVFFMPTAPADPGDIRSRWAYVPGACWRHPEGPGSTIEGREDQPVVHVAYEDVEAYAAWAGKALATEAECEFAARGGLEGAVFSWGYEFTPNNRYMPNTWQGPCPYRDEDLDGFMGRAPVGSFPPNGYGLYDMIGNVWEWTTDWYSDHHPPKAEGPCCVPHNPQGGPQALGYDQTQPGIRTPAGLLRGLLSLRAKLLPALPSGGTASADDRHRHLSYRISLCDTPRDYLNQRAEEEEQREEDEAAATVSFIG